MSNRSAIHLALVFVAATLPVAEAARPSDEARFELNGEKIDEQTFHAFVGAEYRDSRDASAIFQSLYRERVIEAEARRLGVDVAPAEIDQRLSGIERQTVVESGGAKDLDAVLAETGVSRREFRLVLERSLLLEKIARHGYGNPDGEVSDAKVTLWLQDRMKRAVIETRRLPSGVVARVDGEPITVAEFGRRYATQFPAGSERLRRLETECLRAEIARQAAQREGIEIDRPAVDAAVAERERALRARPGFGDTTLDEFLQKTGSSVAVLREKPSFLTQLRLDRLVTEVHHPGPELYFFYRSRIEEFDRLYGETVDLSVILLKAGEPGATQAGFAPRRVEDASAELSALRRRIEQGRHVFASIAQTRSDHPTAQAGGAIGWVGAAHEEFGPLASVALEADEDASLLGPIRHGEGVWLIEIHGRRPPPRYAGMIREIRRHAALRLLDGIARQAHVVRGP